MDYKITRIHWPTAGVHRLSLYLVGTPVLFRIEEWSFDSKNARLLQFLKEIQVILQIKIFIYYTLEFDIKIGREKRDKPIRIHTKLRSAVYSNSLVMNNQKIYRWV